MSRTPHLSASSRGATGADLVRGDAGDRDLLRRVVAGGPGGEPVAEPVAAVFHCIHTSYDARAWAADLPDREQAVMDVTAEYGVPVVFPESVYAFGTAAQDLDDGPDGGPDGGTAERAVTGEVEPASPLGEIRARLLAARAAHPARTISVVAADLIGPTADPASAVFQLLVFGPAAAGKRAWVLGDPDVPRSVTWIPDLTAAMVSAAEHAGELAPRGTAVLLAPTTLTMTQRQMAEAVAPDGRARVSHIPWWILRVAGVFSPMMRELRRQRYLWDAPAVLRPGTWRKGTDCGPPHRRMSSPVPTGHTVRTGAADAANLDAMSTTSQVAANQGVSGATAPSPDTAASTAQAPSATPAKSLSRADRFMYRMLRIRPEQIDKIDMEAIAGAHRAFRWAIVVSAVRCTISYVIIPILIPVLSVMGSLAAPITIALCVVALVNGWLGVRRFWVTDHRGKWGYTWFMALIYVISIVTIVHEIVKVVS
ncbi:hypothetical protein ACTXOW_08825 [Corynebacterium variabile]|uniref:hypothetical protein n=3 Tax=Corynebacterium variabile TaxID=1727 RepID=UPI003F92B4EB